MGNFKKRLERLERGRKGIGFPIVIVEPGETAEEAWQRHLAEYPEHEKAEGRIIIQGDDQDQPQETATTQAAPSKGYRGHGTRSRLDN